MPPAHRLRPTTTIWDTCDLECSHCGSRLTRSASATGAYFSCARCDRTYASAYDEVVRRSAGVRPTARVKPAPKQDARFRQVKARLESFLRRLDEEDAWYVLGVPPGAPLEEVHARYRELALLHHPDRGGDPEKMRRISRAFEAIRSGRAVPNAGPAGIKPPPVDEDTVRPFAVGARRG
ncbi:MAG TPA: DnaJ domain-containing protein [Vulgatibacter sp.]|nr:DnaJ domain-containing protein [Vulgatibacter sp.]